MKRRIAKLICILLCLLLLGCCGRYIPANWKLYAGDPWNVAGACLELYKMLDPDAYIGISGMGGNTLRCYGVDEKRFEASGMLPEGITLDYHEDEIDPRQSHEIPRPPESETQDKLGGVLRMERSEYPLFPEYVRFTWEREGKYVWTTELNSVSKYVDGQWHIIDQNFNSIAMIWSGLKEEKTYLGTEPNNCLGEGLYRISLIDSGLYLEFIVTEDAEPLEPLPPSHKPTERAFALNFFWQCELPENCRSLAMPGKIEWPKESSSYTAAPWLKADAEHILRELPEEGFTANDDASPTVSPYEAAAAVLPGLREIEQEFSVTAAEFCYAYHGDDHTALRPTWLFRVTCSDGSEEQFAVDAHSGRLTE